MSNKPNHYCRICGKEFYACDDCDLRIGISWRQTACSELHGKLYSIIIQYRDNEISKEEASQHIQSTGIAQNEIDSFIPEIKNKINEMLSVFVSEPEVVKKVGRPSKVKNFEEAE